MNHFFHKTYYLLMVFLLASVLLSAKEGTDTTEAHHLIQLSEKYWYTFPDSSVLLAEEAVTKMDTAVHFKLLSHAYSSLATAWYLKGDHARSLDFYFKALHLDEQMNDSSCIASDLNNIGNIYLVQSKYDKAYEFFSSALAIKNRMKDTEGIGRTILSIANMYVSQEEYDLALTHALQALNIFDSLNLRSDLVNIYATLGSVYNNLNKPEEALRYYDSAMAISKAMKDYQNECVISINMGNVFLNQGKTGKAILYYEGALSLAQDINYLQGLTSSFEKLFMVYEMMNMPEEAFQYYKLYVYMRDSLARKENLEALVKNDLEYKFEKERERAIMEQEKKDLLVKEKEKRQNLFLLAVLILFCGALLVAFLIFRSYREKKKANQLLEHKNSIIAQQNRDITDSIEYARRIQSAMVNSEYQFKKYHFDHFILYYPKHIVSGDFYYLTPAPAEGSGFDESTYLIATADSTGHGVPGAFMSLIGIMMLDEIIVQRKVTRPDLVLNYLRAEIVRILNPEGRSEETRDGMDMVFCRYDFKKMNLDFAAANNPLYLIRNGNITEYPPDKMPIGLHYGKEKPFTHHTIELQKGDLIYTITDGYPDQLGGPKGKKLKYNTMKDLFVSVHRLPMEEQKKKIEATFLKWKGEYEQTDDICVIGIRV